MRALNRVGLSIVWLHSASLLGCVGPNLAGKNDGGAANGAPGGPGSGPPGSGVTPVGGGAPLTGRNGFPGDFPILLDQGGLGAGEVIQGFGGDGHTDQMGNRNALRRRPVVLLHGNGVNTSDARFGMINLVEPLHGAGYVDAEIWAPSYLGQLVSQADVPTPQRANIEEVRAFIDAVLQYLGVERVDLVGHSLGCGMINGYLRGLRTDGSFDPALRRFDRVGTVVCLGGAVYGMGANPLFGAEFDSNSAWIQGSLTLDGVVDATPFGARALDQMVGPSTGGTLPSGRPFHEVSDRDAGPRVHWVALWAIGDVVDANVHNGCALGGADLNQGFELPDTLPGTLSPQLARHGQLLHRVEVFNAFAPYLGL